ncbi:actin depolymerizing protein [Cantharellus anzutake]|uniref:actin depolymerizing protein n=1 Tax=Cantharellus anzutake TaxID=1750568 RepID=UPI001906AF4D|nr:actin depolymerizing protein [Cantharellus anzutake]KAF8328882.1 actin depolymerizing protein [Cantharellus anzutake]
MSTSSGIAVSADLAAAYASAINDSTVRFVIVEIQDDSIPSSGGTLVDDLPLLQSALEDTVPAYVLARLDSDDTAWLFITYVPEGATMLYASTRGSLTKEFGDQRFRDSLFATSKSDITPEGYAAHLKHNAAPSPLSAREAEIAAVRAAEGNEYVSSKTRTSHLHVAANRVETKWSAEADEAFRDLGAGDPSFNLIVVEIDVLTESLGLKEKVLTTIDEIKHFLPKLNPSYALYAYDHEVEGSTMRDIICIYACPTSSPVKSRMLYSASLLSFVQILRDNCSIIVAKKVETSEPDDLDLSWVKGELSPSYAPVIEKKTGFAKPRGPARRPR